MSTNWRINSQSQNFWTTWLDQNISNPVHHQQMALDEAKIRYLLEHWVSELSPAIAYDEITGTIIGLCDVDVPLGVKPFIFTGRV